MMMKKEIDNDHVVTCVECGNSDDTQMLIIADAPHVIECVVCGHPNDRTWDDDDEFYDMLLDVVM
ncbi:MAG: hypothetical protein VW270_18755 [Candidatus Poseidoniales archaeon]